MAEHALAEHQRAAEPVATAPQRTARGGRAAAVLALQRTVGNAAVTRLLGRRSLQRCPSCGGTCKGACTGHDEELLEEDRF